MEYVLEGPSTEGTKIEIGASACGDNGELTLAGFTGEAASDLANISKEVSTAVSEIVKIESVLQNNPNLKDATEVGLRNVKTIVTELNFQENVLSTCEIPDNMIGNILSEGAKIEAAVGEPFSVSFDDGSQVTLCNVNYDKITISAGKNDVSVSQESSLGVKIKKENEDENEITHKLVGHFSDSSLFDIQAALAIKSENNYERIKVEHYSDDRKNGCDGNVLSVSTDSKGSFNETNRKVGSGSNLKLPDLSVVLEDLFPNRLRKLGKAHSNTGSCLCIYCQGEYRYSGDPQHLPRNLQNRKQLICSQNFSDKVRSNSDNQPGSKLKVYQEAQKNRSVFKCDKCSRLCKDRTALYNHLPVHGTPYKCRFCSEQFALMASLHYHWEEHNIDKPFKCRQCPAKFWYESTLETHLRVHNKEKPFECKQCSAKFTQEGTLKVHMSVHKAKRPFKCKQCSADFKFKSNLTVHLRVHSGEKPFICKHCSYKCLTSTNLKNHLRVHSNEKPYQCNQCPAKFKQSGVLKLHSRVHSGEKPYLCKLCPLRFAQSSTLSSHLKNVHSDVKPFACKLCPAKFKWRTALNTHSRIHSGERPFKCALCPTGFKTHGHLGSHMISKHSDAKPFHCALCPKTFKFKKCIKTHLRGHLGEKPYECKDCPARFTFKTCLNSHLAVHSGERPYECKLCPSKFARSKTLRTHIQNMHSNGIRAYECKLCPAKFKAYSSLYSHSKTHSNEKLYKCKACPAEFIAKYGLKEHEKRHSSGKSLSCAHCPAYFKLKRSLVKHLKICH